jgi:hypothetical protein
MRCECEAGTQTRVSKLGDNCCHRPCLLSRTTVDTCLGYRPYLRAHERASRAGMTACLSPHRLHHLHVTPATGCAERCEYEAHFQKGGPSQASAVVR